MPRACAFLISVPVRGCLVTPLKQLSNAPLFLNSTVSDSRYLGTQYDSFATLSNFRTTVSITPSLEAANRKQNRPRGNS